MTYRRNTGQGNYTKLYNPADFSLDLPESVDWRTNNAVTNIKDQVRTHLNRLGKVHVLLDTISGSHSNRAIDYT